MIDIEFVGFSGGEPTRATEKAAALDIRVNLEDPNQVIHLLPDTTYRVNSGIKVALPENTAILLLPRSGLGNQGLVITNTIGLIDEDYRGIVFVNLINLSRLYGNEDTFKLAHGMRICQAVFIPIVPPIFNFTSSLPPTKRGVGGDGSTGTM